MCVLHVPSQCWSSVALEGAPAPGARIHAAMAPLGDGRVLIFGGARREPFGTGAPEGEAADYDADCYEAAFEPEIVPDALPPESPEASSSVPLTPQAAAPKSTARSTSMPLLASTPRSR